MKFFSLLIIVLFILSCKKSAVSANLNNVIDSIHGQFSIKEQEWFYSTGYYLGGRTKFEYIHSKIAKRSGGYTSYIFNPYQHTDKKYDTVVYLNNKIWLFAFDKTYPPPHKPKKWIIDMEGGKIKSRISIWGNVAEDTVYYFYDFNNRIKRTERHNSTSTESYVYIRNFEFVNDNLHKISGIYMVEPNTVMWTSEEIFSLYDNAANPLQKNNFWIWEDLYTRTLSKNNFAKYSFTRYDTSNNVMGSSGFTLQLLYDADGNIRLN